VYFLWSVVGGRWSVVGGRWSVGIGYWVLGWETGDRRETGDIYSASHVERARMSRD